MRFPRSAPHFKGSRSSQRLFTAVGICGIDLVDRQFRVVVYLVDVQILGFSALMGVQLSGSYPTDRACSGAQLGDNLDLSLIQQ